MFKFILKVFVYVKRILCVAPVSIRKHIFFNFPDVIISGKPVFCKPNVSGNSIIY